MSYFPINLLFKRSLLKKKAQLKLECCGIQNSNLLIYNEKMTSEQTKCHILLSTYYLKEAYFKKFN